MCYICDVNEKNKLVSVHDFPLQRLVVQLTMNSV
jgi:hypothetical protein